MKAMKKQTNNVMILIEKKIWNVNDENEIY